VKLVKLGTLDSRARTDFDPAEFTTFATATATRGSTTTPTTGMRTHHPGTKKHAYKQTKRNTIATTYCPTRVCRSSLGETGNEVRDCVSRDITEVYSRHYAGGYDDRTNGINYGR
jgi:hypothetical protein